MRWMFSSALRLLPAAIICCLFQGNAAAEDCTYDYHSNHRILSENFHNIGFTLCETHFPEGSTQRAAVQHVIDILNDVQGSDIHFYIKGYEPHTSYASTGIQNGVNKIDMVSCTDTTCCNAGGDCSFDGRTLPKPSAGAIQEFDLVFDASRNWDYGPPQEWDLTGYDTAGRARTYYQSVLLHEIGHGLGFQHTETRHAAVSIMGFKTGKWIANKQVGLKAFDQGHILFHYAKRNTGKRPDLLLSNYKTIPRSDLPVSSGIPHMSFELALNDGISATFVPRGRSFNMTWTRMNAGGPVKKKYHTHVYLSRNETLDSSDRLVKSWVHQGRVNEYSTLSASTTIQVPSDLPTGNYYAILKIDSDQEITEHHEDNNILTIWKQFRVTM